jgi:hypothetical protein
MCPIAHSQPEQLQLFRRQGGVEVIGDQDQIVTDLPPRLCDSVWFTVRAWVYLIVTGL